MDAVSEQFKYFESQELDESVVLVTRKHWLHLLTPFIIGFFLIGMFVGLYYFSKKFPINAVNIPDYMLETILFTIILFVLSYIYTSWLMRYYNVVILTDEHLVEIEQIALFSRKVSVLDLDHIEDVSFGQHGFLQTMLDFGDLEIQTAGEIRNFIFKNIKDPDCLQKEIMELKELEEDERKTKASEPLLENNTHSVNTDTVLEKTTPAHPESETQKYTPNVRKEDILGEEPQKISEEPPKDLSI